MQCRGCTCNQCKDEDCRYHCKDVPEKERQECDLKITHKCKVSKSTSKDE